MSPISKGMSLLLVLVLLHSYKSKILEITVGVSQILLSLTSPVVSNELKIYPLSYFTSVAIEKYS